MFFEAIHSGIVYSFKPTDSQWLMSNYQQFRNTDRSVTCFLICQFIFNLMMNYRIYSMISRSPWQVALHDKSQWTLLYLSKYILIINFFVLFWKVWVLLASSTQKKFGFLKIDREIHERKLFISGKKIKNLLQVATYHRINTVHAYLALDTYLINFDHFLQWFGEVQLHTVLGKRSGRVQEWKPATRINNDYFSKYHLVTLSDLNLFFRCNTCEAPKNPDWWVKSLLIAVDTVYGLATVLCVFTAWPKSFFQSLWKGKSAVCDCFYGCPKSLGDVKQTSKNSCGAKESF